MSSPILPIQGPAGSSDGTPRPPARSDYVRDFVAALAADDGALTVDVARGGPTPEVLAQMAAAGLISERMRSDGQSLRFSTPQPGERVRIELADAAGNTVRSVSATDAIELAAGTRRA
jgi:hypothetical protein